MPSSPISVDTCSTSTLAVGAPPIRSVGLAHGLARSSLDRCLGPGDAVANDEHVVGLHTSDTERDGPQVRSPTALVFHVQDGRIVETWSHHYNQHEFDEFWA